MFTREEIKGFKDELPLKGIQMIKSRTGISRPTIYKFLEGEEIRLHLAEKIWKAGWLIIQEMKEKRAELKRHAEEVLNKEY